MKSENRKKSINIDNSLFDMKTIEKKRKERKEVKGKIYILNLKRAEQEKEQFSIKHLCRRKSTNPKALHSPTLLLNAFDCLCF